MCDQFVHSICGSYGEDSEGFGLRVTRNLCVRNNRIKIEREGAKSGQEQQAQKAVSPSNSRLPAVRTNVVVKVPVLDRGRLTYLLTYLLTPWCTVLLEQLTGLQLVKKFPNFTEPEGLLLHSQASATCLYPGPAQSSPYIHIPPPADPS